MCKVGVYVRMCLHVRVCVCMTTSVQVHVYVLEGGSQRSTLDLVLQD